RCAAWPRDLVELTLAARSCVKIAVVGDGERDEVCLRTAVIHGTRAACLDVEHLAFRAGRGEQAGSALVENERPDMARVREGGEGLRFALCELEHLSVRHRRREDRSV